MAAVRGHSQRNPPDPFLLQTKLLRRVADAPAMRGFSMQRRDFFKSMAAVGATATLPGPLRAAAPAGWRQFEITYRVALKNEATPARVWLPVPQDALDYQRVIDLSWRSPVAALVMWDEASRAPMVSAAWPDPTVAREIEVTAHVATRDRSGFSRGVAGRAFRISAPDREFADRRHRLGEGTGNRRRADRAARQGASDLRLDRRQHVPPRRDARLRSRQHRFHAASGRHGRQMRRHQLALCRAGARRGIAGERFLRNSRRRLEKCRDRSANQGTSARRSTAGPRCLSTGRAGCRSIRRMSAKLFSKSRSRSTATR